MDKRPTAPPRRLQVRIAQAALSFLAFFYSFLLSFVLSRVDALPSSAGRCISHKDNIKMAFLRALHLSPNSRFDFTKRAVPSLIMRNTFLVFRLVLLSGLVWCVEVQIVIDVFISSFLRSFLQLRIAFFNFRLLER